MTPENEVPSEPSKEETHTWHGCIHGYDTSYSKETRVQIFENLKYEEA